MLFYFRWGNCCIPHFEFLSLAWLGLRVRASCGLEVVWELYKRLPGRHVIGTLWPYVTRTAQCGWFDWEERMLQRCFATLRLLTMYVFVYQSLR